MIRRVFLHTLRVERIAILESKDRLVLGTVILVDAPNILPQRHSPNEQKEQQEADASVDQVENDPSTQRWIDLLQFRRGQQRDVFVHEDEKAQREQEIPGSQPVTDGGRLLASLGRCLQLGSSRGVSRWRNSRRGCLRMSCLLALLHYVFDGN